MPSGSCYCGSLKYSFEGEPVAKALCHCRDCQKISGSTYSTNIVVPGDGFKILAGNPKQYASKADSGSTPNNFFCPDCGSVCWRESEGTFGNNKIIKVGTIDDPKSFETYKPVLELYTKSRVGYLPALDGADQKEGMP